MFEFGEVLLRPVEKEDLKTIRDWINDPELISFSRSMSMSFSSMPQLEREYENWTQDKSTLYFLVRIVATREVIGAARITRVEWGNVRYADIGMFIGDKEMWGRGIGKQIALALLEIAFNQFNMERCEARNLGFNEKVAKVLEDCGFKKAGEFRMTVFINGKKWNNSIYDILRDEYLALRTKLINETLGPKSEGYLQSTIFFS